MIKKETLQQLYEKQELSMREIAGLLGVAVGTVYNYMKKYQIESRTEVTDKTRSKISASNKGKVSPRKGCHLSEETKRKISEAHKGKFTERSQFGGHKKKRSDGYIYIYTPDHPYSSKDGYVMEHILVMENHIGRYITKDEVVHHKNKIRNDNRIENLQLMTFKEHSGLHMKERWDERKRNSNGK